MNFPCRKKAARLLKYCWTVLLIFALIAARSCKRFRLLSEGLEDEYLRRRFYRRFMVSQPKPLPPCL